MISLRGESIEFHFCTQALLMALFTLVHHQRKGSCDLDVCGLHGDHVMGVISSRGESMVSFLYIGTPEGCLPLYIIKGYHCKQSCDLDQTGCHEDHVMCLSIPGRICFHTCYCIVACRSNLSMSCGLQHK